MFSVQQRGIGRIIGILILALAVSSIFYMVDNSSVKGAGLLVSVEPDAHAEGTNISAVFPGFTLSQVGSCWATPDGNIYSVDPSTKAEPYSASTGSLVFGTSDGSFPHLFREMGFCHLRVDFGPTTDTVRVDFIGSINTEKGILRAYNSSDALLDTYTTGSLSVSQVETASVGSVIRDIAYVIASGDSPDSSIGIDHLQYTVSTVGGPTTFLVNGSGPSAGNIISITAAAGVVAALVASGTWYTRRRWLRS